MGTYTARVSPNGVSSTYTPSLAPYLQPSSAPSLMHSSIPSFEPSLKPSLHPSVIPSYGSSAPSIIVASPVVVMYGLQGYSVTGTLIANGNYQFTYDSYNNCEYIDITICNACGNAGKVSLGLLLMSFLFFCILITQLIVGIVLIADKGLQQREENNLEWLKGFPYIFGTLLCFFVMCIAAWGNWRSQCYQAINASQYSSALTLSIGFNCAVACWAFMTFVFPFSIYGALIGYDDSHYEKLFNSFASLLNFFWNIISGFAKFLGRIQLLIFQFIGEKCRQCSNINEGDEKFSSPPEVGSEEVRTSLYKYQARTRNLFKPSQWFRSPT